MIVAFLRHGPTEWNADRRLQGRTDIPLSDDARKLLRGQRAPAALGLTRCLTSPLSRATGTAELVWPGKPVQEAALIELDFGDWEGGILAELRREDPAGMAEIEDRGLDMTPPKGESPRQVRARLAALLLRLGPTEGNILMVTHKGVIRAALSLATGWEYQGRPPVKFEWPDLQCFDLAPDGAFTLDQINVPLEPK